MKFEALKAKVQDIHQWDSLAILHGIKVGLWCWVICHGTRHQLLLPFLDSWRNLEGRWARWFIRKLLDREGLEIGQFAVKLPNYSGVGARNLHPCFGLYLGTFWGCQCNQRDLEVLFQNWKSCYTQEAGFLSQMLLDKKCHASLTGTLQFNGLWWHWPCIPTSASSLTNICAYFFSFIYLLPLSEDHNRGCRCFEPWDAIWLLLIHAWPNWAGPIFNLPHHDPIGDLRICPPRNGILSISPV